MNRRSLAVGLAAVVAGVGMAAVEAGLVGHPTVGDPVWLAIGGLVVGYWAVFIRWARS